MKLILHRLPERRQAQVTWILLAVFFLSAEVVFRKIEVSVSGNIAHLQSLEHSFEKMRESPAPRTAFIGNSLTGEGVNHTALETKSRQTTMKVVPDSTAIWDWQCLIDRFVLADGLAPVENIVIGFAWNQLSDQVSANPSRLGGYMCRYDRIFEPASIGLRNFEQITEFATAATLKIYANRDTIRNRFLDLIVPKYKEYTRKTNNAARQTNAVSASESVASHNELRKLIDQLKKKNVSPIFIAMPVKQPYQISAGLRETLRELSTPLLDYRSLTGIKDDSFADEIHLNQSGRHLLTQKLVADLIPLLKD